MTRSRVVGANATPPILLPSSRPQSALRRVLSPGRARVLSFPSVSRLLLLGNGTYRREHSDAKRAVSLCRKNLLLHRRRTRFYREIHLFVHRENLWGEKRKAKAASCVSISRDIDTYTCAYARARKRYYSFPFS